jgi:hypothetical protein
VAPGSTLFHIAAKYLNDATQWSRLAAINGINDPFLNVPEALLIPNASVFPRLTNGNQS